MTGWDLAASQLAAHRRYLLFSMMTAEVRAGQAQVSREGWWLGEPQYEVRPVFYSGPVQRQGLLPGAIAFEATCPSADDNPTRYEFVVDEMVDDVTDLVTGAPLNVLEQEMVEFFFALACSGFRYTPQRLRDEILLRSRD